MPWGCLCSACKRWTAGAEMKCIFDDRCHRCSRCHNDDRVGCGKKKHIPAAATR